jgi:hypothetical protein
MKYFSNYISLKKDIKKKLDEQLKEKLLSRKQEIVKEVFGKKDDVPVDVLEGEDIGECDTCWVDTDMDENELQERRIVYRIKSDGKRIRRVRCGPGKRVVDDNGIKKCIVVSGTERVKKRLSVIQSLRTKRALGVGLTRRTTRKRLKALRRRKAMGLNVGRRAGS